MIDNNCSVKIGEKKTKSSRAHAAQNNATSKQNDVIANFDKILDSNYGIVCAYAECARFIQTK